jgi:hypothetical protein
MTRNSQAQSLLIRNNVIQKSEPQEDPGTGSNTQQLLIVMTLAGSLSLVQLIMSRHKYHFFNLPASLATFSVVGSKLKNKTLISIT